jgi:uncharacterized membrane protein
MMFLAGMGAGVFVVLAGLAAWVWIEDWESRRRNSGG